MSNPTQTLSVSLDGLRDPASLDVRGDALEVIINRRPAARDWLRAEGDILNYLEDTRDDPVSRGRAVELAAFAPLRATRDYLRHVAHDAADPATDSAKISLARLGDPDCANRLIDVFAEKPADTYLARALAQSPLERPGINSEKLAGVLQRMNREDPDESGSYLWGALALGRAGEFGPLRRAISELGKGWEPNVLWGNPENFATDLKTMRPVPEALTQFLRGRHGWQAWVPAILPWPKPHANPAVDRIADALAPPLQGGDSVSLPQPTDVAGVLHKFAERQGLSVTVPVAGAVDADAFSDMTADLFKRSLTAFVGRAEADGWAMPEEVVGNEFVYLLDKLPPHRVDLPAVTDAYLDFLRRTGSRSSALETQIGWWLSRNDFDAVVTDAADYLNSPDPQERAVTWSIVRNAARLQGKSDLPIFGAGPEVGGDDDLMLAARDVELLGSELMEAAAEPPEPTRGGLSEDGDLSPPTSGAEPPEDLLPSKAYALLDCPSEVLRETWFEVTVGLSREKSAGTAGSEMTLPVRSTAYLIKVRLICDGFRLEDGQQTELQLEVSKATPYPKQTLRLFPETGDKFRDVRTIMATYSVEGQLLGAAARPVTLVDTLSTDAAGAAVAGLAVAPTSSQDQPDITLTIGPGNRATGFRMIWSVDTIHPEIDVTEPDDPGELAMDLGDDSGEWARKLMNKIDSKEGSATLQDAIEDAGLRIADKIPVWVQRKLIEVLELTGDRPPLLQIISIEPHVPWELAWFELRESGRQFLSMEFVVGRWIVGKENPRSGELEPPLPPPPEISLNRMAVISGDYSATAWTNLDGALKEAAYFRDNYNAESVEANEAVLLPWLKGDPEADVIHFCVHGKWDKDGYEDGIALIDGTMLEPSTIRVRQFTRHPFVFLNACQVGQGDTVLGDYGGMAEAFLRAGASAVIAPLWSVNDDDARKVAQRFYDGLAEPKKPGDLAGPKKPGDLVRLEKLGFLKDPTSGTFLAYQFFGNPSLRMNMNIEKRSTDP